MTSVVDQQSPTTANAGDGYREFITYSMTASHLGTLLLLEVDRRHQRHDRPQVRLLAGNSRRCMRMGRSVASTSSNPDTARHDHFTVWMSPSSRRRCCVA
ncbi:MAG: hypothetical protein U0792_02860 [Gemmataceae bacterium]